MLTGGGALNGVNRISRRSVVGAACLAFALSIGGGAAVASSQTRAAAEVAEAAPCPPKGTKIGYSPLSMSYEWFSYVVKGVKAEAKRCGVTVIVTDPGADAAKQASQLENMVTAGVKAIGLMPNDAKAVDPAVKKALAAGVKMVEHDVQFNGAQGIVAVSNYQFGFEIGKIGGKWLRKAKPNQDSYQVALLNSDSLGENLIKRRVGLIAGLKAGLAGKPYKLVANQEAYLEPKALDVASTILQKNPKLDLFLCTNDVCALGASSAIKAAGRKPGKDAAAVGSATVRVLQAIIAGEMPGGLLVPGIPAGESVTRAMFYLLAGRKPGFTLPEAVVPVTTVADAKRWLKTKGN
jgi:ABC-type sugar transport system substrate-binding protein